VNRIMTLEIGPTLTMACAPCAFEAQEFSVVSQKFVSDPKKMQTQILRLTTPKLKYVWGPVRSE
jgi:hypothetical protein